MVDLRLSTEILRHLDRAQPGVVITKRKIGSPGSWFRSPERSYRIVDVWDAPLELAAERYHSIAGYSTQEAFLEAWSAAHFGGVDPTRNVWVQKLEPMSTEAPAVKPEPKPAQPRRRRRWRPRFRRGNGDGT
jgi:hypothetical protein